MGICDSPVESPALDAVEVEEDLEPVEFNEKIEEAEAYCDNILAKGEMGEIAGIPLQVRLD